MKRITNGYNKLGINAFVHLLRLIVSGLKGNAYFTSLQAAVTVLSTEADTFYDLVLKAAKRDQDAIVARDLRRATITAMLHDLGLEVSAIAKGDLNILTASNMPFSQPRQVSPPMVKPSAPVVALGVNVGEIACKTGPQRGMKAVNYYITSDSSLLNTEDSSAWNVTSWNKTKFTFSSLTPGQRYYVKVGLVGVRGQEVISDAVSYIAQ